LLSLFANIPFVMQKDREIEFAKLLGTQPSIANLKKLRYGY
jgi:hypothetical protein